MTKGKLLIVTALFTSVVTSIAYSKSEATNSTATIVFKKSYDEGSGIGKETIQGFYSLPAGSCKGRKQQARFGWFPKAEIQKQLPAEEKLYLWMFTNHVSGNFEYLCQNSVSFVPRHGATYQVSINSRVKSDCKVSVFDVKTGAEPQDLLPDKSVQCIKLKTQ